MSKTWYPMINYERCIECGLCVDMCSHGVYDENKAPRPVVVAPGECVTGCKGCAGQCPSEAIEYFGDTGAATDNTACCDGDCDCGSGGCGENGEEETLKTNAGGCGCIGGCCE